jgi:hypothetical protein
MKFAGFNGFNRVESDLCGIIRIRTSTRVGRILILAQKNLSEDAKIVNVAKLYRVFKENAHVTVCFRKKRKSKLTRKVFRQTPKSMSKVVKKDRFG